MNEKLTMKNEKLYGVNYLLSGVSPIVNFSFFI